MLARKIWKKIRAELVKTYHIQDGQDTHPLSIFVHSGHIDESVNFSRSKCYLLAGSTVAMKAQTIIKGSIHFHRPGAFDIGARSYIGENTEFHIATKIVIGDDVMISWGCTLIDTNMHSLHYKERQNDILISGRFNGFQASDKDWSSVKSSPIYVENKAWIGFNTIILKGVRIGEGSIVGAGSVVTKDVPAWTLVAGNPASVIRPLTEDDNYEINKNIKSSSSLFE